MCITELFCCTPEINITLYINYTSIKKQKKINKKQKLISCLAEVVCSLSHNFGSSSATDSQDLSSWGPHV